MFLNPLERRISAASDTLTVVSNPATAHQLFRHTVGMSWVGYLQGYRVRRAAALLSESRSSITEAALAVGFESLSHFNQVFRSFMGASPREYRNQGLAIKSI